LSTAYSQGGLRLDPADTRTSGICLRLEPSEKLEAVEAVVPPELRRGRFKAPDALIASLLRPGNSGAYDPRGNFLPCPDPEPA
jgi:hypothetical protein